MRFPRIHLFLTLKYSLLKYSLLKYSLLRYSLLKYSLLKYSLLKYSILAFFLLLPQTSSSSPFHTFFVDKTVRVDCYHSGTKGTETFSLDQVLQEGPWAGSLVNLIDTLYLGEYQVRVYDEPTATLICSRGYSSMFNEWQSTDEALAGIFRTFHETLRIPYPKRNIQLTICRRDKKMDFHEAFSTVIDPNSPTQVNREKWTPLYNVVPLSENGSPHDKVDLLI